MNDYMKRLRDWQEWERAMVEKIRCTPLEEWHSHPDIMEKVQREGFDISAAIVRRDARARKEADAY